MGTLDDYMLYALKQMGRRPPFDRPLAFGNREQARCLAIMNGDVPYCPRCFEEGEFVGASVFL